MGYEYIDNIQSDADYGWWKVNTFEEGNSYKNSNFQCISSTSLKYHSSWDWLIPAIQKIMGMKEFDGTEQESDAWYAYYSIESMILWATPTQVFKKVVTVLKRYNEIN